MKINLYAPVDCEVKPITECKDEMFSKKMMGDGICITPLKPDFNSFIESGKVALIFGTKHAIFFESNGVKILMHIGMDTVTLKGEPFDVKVKMGDNLSLDKNIISVDLKKLKQEKLSVETPIVFDNENIEKISIKIIKTGTAKQGELIASASITLKAEKNKKPARLTEFKSKYLLAAEYLIDAVGGPTNFSKVYNCMTRVRWTIKDKDAVKTDKVKKQELVKGINWNGNELQVIIGGECYKVKEEVEKIISGAYSKEATQKDNVQKLPVMKRVMGAIAGIMVPIIPLLMVMGLAGALQAILVAVQVIPSGLSSPDQGGNLWQSFFLLIQQVTTNAIGIMFIYSVARYFGGNTILAVIIGIILSSRFFFSVVGAREALPFDQLDEAFFGQWVSLNAASPVDGLSTQFGWFMFNVGNTPIAIRSYEGTVLPFVAAGILSVYLDKWIKTWMPAIVDIIFRSVLVVILTLIPILLVLGPALALLETGLASVVLTLESPYLFGIGTALFAFFWQILVLTGVHVAVVVTVMTATIWQQIPTVLLPPLTIAVFAQLGATIGVAIATKNSNLRTNALSFIPAAIFGITEPIIYGVNLMKVKPFFAACCAAAVGGFLSFWFGIQQSVPAGQGVFAILGVIEPLSQGLLALTWIITIGCAVLFTMLVYTEKWSETKYSKKIFNKLNRFATNILIASGIKKTQVKETLNNIEKDYLLNIENEKDLFKKYLKYLSNKSKLDQKLIKLKAKEEKMQKKLYNKAFKLQNAKVIDENALQTAISKYNQYSLDAEKQLLINQIAEIEKINSILEKEYVTTTAKLEKEAEKVINEVVKYTNYQDFQIFNNGLFNGLNSIKIAFGIVDEKKYTLTKKQLTAYKEYINNLKK